MRSLIAHFKGNGKTANESVLAQQEFLGALNEIVALDQLLDYVSAGLRDISGASAVNLLLHEPITGRFTPQPHANSEFAVHCSDIITPSSKLVRWLTTNRIPLHLLHQPDAVQYLSHGEQELLATGNTRLVIPCFVLDRMTCLIFLAGREGGEDYRQDKIDLLSRLALQAALAIEHASMYQLQEDRLKRLFLADKLATVGELAARAAHEIRNPLAFIRSSIQLLKDHIPPEKSHLADALIQESDRIDAIIEGLLSLSRSSDVRKTIVHVKPLIEQTLSLLGSELISREIAVCTKYGTSDAAVPGDPSQLRQLLLNLLINSMQAIPSGGSITIEVEETVPSRKEGGMVRLKIRDSGAGIPANVLPKVFDPFFTTKTTGTGLGLSIGYGIVKQHGGQIEIRSSTTPSASGTTINLSFPSANPYPGKAL